MAYEGAPYVPQDPQAVKEMLKSLEAHSKKGGRNSKNRGGFSAKKHTYPIDNNRTVDSWKLPEWDYKNPHLPTYARGLFTYTDHSGRDTIAVRGYDKFFNEGEVNETKWRNIERNTIGPYELSIKENGCIIFMAGLDDGTLLVCSKHSTGDREDANKSHARVGERWAEKHLASVGKTKTDLARTLYAMNATAVAELCDDEFEEHVLAYNPEASGLYLHGINLNLPEFATYPAHLVDQFGAEWGFKKTMHVVEDNIGRVKAFLDQAAETGSYDGRETEGFVIRCKVRDSEYAPYRDWFFKYKFEEPYLMYRQWRECTKAVIAGKPPRYKKHKQVTEAYLAFARREIAKNPKLAKEYNQNHGIIGLRDAFLAEMGVKGSDIIRQELETGAEVDPRKVTRDIVLVPIATIGCGKTTVAVALAKLFSWGHVQNDNIEGKRNRGERFASAAYSLMLENPVVIADRNNHQCREREQIMRDLQRMNPNARFVALHWVHDRSNYDQIREKMQSRVLTRGDNHQTIQAASKGEQEVVGIMEGFLQRFQPADPSKEPDDGFDLIIDLSVTADSRENLETVVTQLHNQYPSLFTDMPTTSDLDAAIESALNDYNPDFKQDLGNRSKNLQEATPSKRQQKKAAAHDSVSAHNAKLLDTRIAPKVEFFAVRLPAARINSLLDSTFRDQPPEIAQFYRSLHSQRRVQAEFHVTLIHKIMSVQRGEIWKHLVNTHTPKYKEVLADLRSRVESGQKPGKLNREDIPEPDLGRCGVRLERIVWDNRVMCFVVRLETLEGEETFTSANPIPHITVGTANQSIKPKESNDLLQRWLSKGSGDETGIRDLMVPGQIVVEGTVKGVLSRF
jgi:tRNA ligase